MKFSYSALNKKNELVSGEIEANSRDAVMENITKFGYKPIVIKQIVEKKGQINLFTPKINTEELVVFTRQLSAMISAGVPLVRSITSLSGDGKTPFQLVLKSLIKDIENGATFADSLDKHPEVFDKIYINMVRAGESAGILDDILKRLAIQQEKASSIKKKIKSAMAYPTVLMVVTVIAFFGLMLFVIPKMGEIISGMSDGKGSLPLITQIMLKISGFMVSYWYILIPIIAGTVISIKKYIKTPRGEKVYDRLILKVPKIGELIQKIIVGRFTRTFSALIGAGVSVISALEICADSIGNSVYEDFLRNAINDVKNGKQLSEIVSADKKLWPEIVSQMLAVGEETGSTDTVLVKVADFYEEEVDLAIEQINSIIEPVMIVIMGAVVGLVAVSVMSPIANMSKNIQ